MGETQCDCQHIDYSVIILQEQRFKIKFHSAPSIDRVLSLINSLRTTSLVPITQHVASQPAHISDLQRIDIDLRQVS